MGDNSVVTVAFNTGQTKSLMTKYSPNSQNFDFAFVLGIFVARMLFQNRVMNFRLLCFHPGQLFPRKRFVAVISFAVCSSVQDFPRP